MAQAELVNSAIRAPTTGGSTRPSTTAISATHADATLSGRPPLPIPVDTRGIVFEERADLDKVLNPISVCVAEILEGVAENVLGGPDLRQIDAVLPDLTAEVSRTLQHITQKAWRFV